MSNNISHERYSRQVLLKEFGEAGQQKLLHAKVLMVGAGGLGCAALPYLAAAGIGAIGIVDDDKVAMHNLHRQVLFTVNDIGASKALRAAFVLKQLNPDINIEALETKLTASNALGIFSNYDIIIDGTDNFSTRYLINDACVLLNKPLIYGAVSKFEGQVAIFNCSIDNIPAVNYRDLFPGPPADGEILNCAEAGVLGVLPGIIGSMQANEAIKLIAGIGTPLINRLLTYNALNNQVYELQLTAQEETRTLIPADAHAFKEMDYNWFCGVPSGRLEIDIQQFNALKKERDVLFADVREYGELPVITGFEYISIPLSSIEEFPETAMGTIILFCQSGKRSLKAAEWLAAKFNTKKIFSLGGGILQYY